MAKDKLPEVWLRGPLTDMPALLQPVAHALLQAREELNELMAHFPDELLWNKVAGMASVGFHLQHLTGVLDRLFTYAKGEQLSTEQLDYLAQESKYNKAITAIYLVEKFNLQVDASLKQLEQTDSSILTQKREVGRGKLPSTVIGLYVHGAEHTMRHLGQLLVTVKVLTQSV
ncbi:DinB family protein [Mucilaginibacter dorajii]|uniref:DinB-like domain-containing protein n=1 Tax=Mucilaginibacter dorajii TaxID=692994 RepID=A0ABP7QP52_9SPHI|nr:DinB family protein [Mucilaginibacter dorajii]MCS3733767.1 putative damage-inducible protein DinB [Mucilaginibacter dorajii]